MQEGEEVHGVRKMMGLAAVDGEQLPKVLYISPKKKTDLLVSTSQ